MNGMESGGRDTFSDDGGRERPSSERGGEAGLE